MTVMKRLRQVKEENEQELDSLRTANFLILLSGGEGDDPEVVDPVAYRSRPDRVFECKTCKRQFSSFQALGGHRASHKKHRIIDDLYKDDSPSKRRVHECPICGLEFAVGQALGGHMRRHRNTIEGFASVVPMAKANKMESKKFLDLNLPPCDEEGEILFGIKMSTVH